jgi:hypothetical protein
MSLTRVGGGIVIPSGGIYNPSDNLKLAGEQFGSIADGIANRQKSRAIREILSSTPDANQTADEFRQTKLQALLLDNNNHIDPMEAIDISNAASKPYYDKEAREREEDRRTEDMAIKGAEINNQLLRDTATDSYRTKSLEQQKTIADKNYNKGKWKTFTDDYGKSWKYDSNTGTMTEINAGDYGSGSIPSKHVIMVDKTVPDGFGGYTTIKVPVDKRTGKDADGNIPQVTQQATLTQKDKDFLKNYGQGNTTVGRIRTSLGKPGAYNGVWGGIDAVTGPIGNFFGTKQGGDQALVKQDLENLRLEATNKLSGALSDQDMKIILDTIPTISDQPDVARRKLAKVESAIATAEANQFNRLAKSNPNAVQDLAVGMAKGTTPVPAGYALQYNPSTGQYRLVSK